MQISVRMPPLGESVSRGTVSRWLKEEGDNVSADEPLLEISTDKVAAEIPAPATGVLAAIRIRENETVLVGAELAVIEDSLSGAAADSGQQRQQQASDAAGDGPPATSTVPSQGVRQQAQ